MGSGSPRRLPLHAAVKVGSLVTAWSAVRSESENRRRVDFGPSPQLQLKKNQRMHDEARIKEIFHRYDKDSSDTISIDEMKQALHDLHLPNSDRDVKIAMKEMDVDGDSIIK